ncbi:MAG: hypothetical protein JF627_05115 [Alphaproteobacteria bacterium]|nr:hypothetical protein [Alphaproteobacteria bacterium]
MGITKVAFQHLMTINDLVRLADVMAELPKPLAQKKRLTGDPGMKKARRERKSYQAFRSSGGMEIRA